MRQRTGHRTYVVAALIAALALTLFTIPHVLPHKLLTDKLDLGTLTAHAGSGSEWINIRLDLESALTWSGHSYTVNGSGPYDYVQLKCSIHVEFDNVENVVIDFIGIKAVDHLDGSYHVYTLASNEPVSSSPYDGTFSTGQMSISVHFNDVEATPDDQDRRWIRYYIAVRVSGTGAISGETLTAEIDYTWFNTYVYKYASGSSPPGGDKISSWVLAWPGASLAGLIILACLAFWWARRELRRGARA